MPETLSPKSIVGILIAFVALGAAAYVTFRPRATPRVDRVYFFDLGTQELYAEAAGTIPPTQAPSGGESVAAVVMACGSCDDTQNQFTAYLAKYTDAYRAALKSGGEMPPKVMMNGRLLRAVDGDEWVSAESPQGAALRNVPRQRCQDRSANICVPS